MELSHAVSTRCFLQQHRLSLLFSKSNSRDNSNFLVGLEVFQQYRNNQIENLILLMSEVLKEVISMTLSDLHCSAAIVPIS